MRPPVDDNAIRALARELGSFIPELPGWRDRSPHIVREGRVDVHPAIEPAAFRAKLDAALT